MTAPRILVVDDDSLLREALVKTLNEAGYRTTGAADGKQALALLTESEPALVLSDIRMPELDGIGLLKAARSRSQVPFILMTAFSELLEAHEAAVLGASGFLAKPFRRDELLAMLRQTLGTAKEPAPPALNDSAYRRLCIEDFITGRKVQFDVYIRISEAKYVKVAHFGEDIDPGRINAYRARGIRFLHMRKQDFLRYVGYDLSLMKAPASSDASSLDRRAQLMKHTGEVLHEHLRFDEIEEDEFEYSKTYVENSIDILCDDSDAFNLVDSMQTHSDFFYAHSVGVSFMGVLIARTRGWHAPHNLTRIALGGLLHNIGLREVETAVLNKARRNLTPGEVRLMESHPQRGREALEQIRSIPADVVQIAYQHHENCLGHGYPRGVTRSHIHPFARLIAVADEFCAAAIKNPDGPKLPAFDSVQRVTKMAGSRLDPDFCSALMKLFHMVGVAPGTDLSTEEPL